MSQNAGQGAPGVSTSVSVPNQDGATASEGTTSVAAGVKARGERRPALGKVLPKYMGDKEYVTSPRRLGVRRCQRQGLLL